MERNLQNFRTVFITAPKELADHDPNDLHGEFLDIHFNVPDALDNCKSIISTSNFIQNVNNTINKDSWFLSVFIIDFPNQAAIDRFKIFTNTAYSDNLIDFIENPLLSDIYNLVDTYLFTILENPEKFGYDTETVVGFIRDWTGFILLL